MRCAALFFQVALLLSALALVAAACGAEDVPAEQGSSPTTARIELVSRVSPGTESEAHRSTHVVDYANDRWSSEDATGCRMIRIGGALYSELPSGIGLPEGKHWVRDESGGELSADSEAAFEQSMAEDAAHSSDNESVMTMQVFAEEEPLPGRYLDELRTIGADVQLVGAEDIRGERTTHYRTFLDVRQRTRRSVEAAGWKPANVDRYVGQMAAGEEQIDVWVGLDGLERRVVSTTRYTDGLLRGEENVTTADYVDYGLEAQIEAPPAAEVVSREQLEQLAEQMDQQPGEAPHPPALPNCR